MPETESRVRPIENYETENVGRLRYRAQHGDTKARAELDRRASATSGGAA